LSRLKIQSNMSIAERRIPQDGRIQTSVGGKLIDLRVSCLPTNHGESIVMRILDKEGRAQVRPLIREGKVGEAIDLEFKRNQITSRFQPDDTFHAATAGVQLRQAEQILLGQGSER